MAVCSMIDVHQLASAVKNRIENVLIIDSRCFIEYNSSHVTSAVNVCCSKIVKRRLQQDKLSVKELLTHTCHCDVDDNCDVVVYDQESNDVSSLSADSFTTILINKLQKAFRRVNLLSGGFSRFRQLYPELCGDKVRKFPPLSSLSQPCLPVTDQGPTRILPFLYLGSQFDALNKETLKDHNITYELNVSTSCPKPDFLPDSHFMRIPVNDNYSEKLLPYFQEAFRFLDKACEANCNVLVHCLAGISRSPTVAIAYVMRYLKLTSDDGYRYVKSKRPTISPNFNFLGQLLEFEKQLRRENVLDAQSDECSSPPLAGKKRLCKTDMRKSPKLSLNINTEFHFSSGGLSSKAGDQSPTTALAKLSFSGPSTPEIVAHQPELHHSRSFDCLSGSEGLFSASKVLSPVKEIKCESLIAEISYGNGAELRSRSRAGVLPKLATASRYGGDTSKCSFPQVFQKPSETVASEIRISKHSETERYPHAKKSFKFPAAFDQPWTTRETVKSEMSYRYHSANPLVPETSSFSFLDVKTPSCRTDSTTTSGFGSESSDCLKASEELKTEFDMEELEDEVMAAEGKKRHFSFTLPELSVSEWPQSPLSPSESHLLEDVSNTNDPMVKSVCSSPSASDQHSLDDSDSQHDSGIPVSPWPWSRKRTAPSDDPGCQYSFGVHTELTVRDKRKCELISEDRFAEEISSATDSRLYRVQSCPGMAYHYSRSVSPDRRTSKARTDSDHPRGVHRHSIGESDHLFAVPGSDTLSSRDSCPGLSQSMPSSPHHRDFRRNVRLIRVS